MKKIIIPIVVIGAVLGIIGINYFAFDTAVNQVSDEPTTDPALSGPTGTSNVCIMGSGEATTSPAYLTTTATSSMVCSTDGYSSLSLDMTRVASTTGTSKQNIKVYFSDSTNCKTSTTADWYAASNLSVDSPTQITYGSAGYTSVFPLDAGYDAQLNALVEPIDHKCTKIEAIASGANSSLHIKGVAKKEY